MWDDSGGAADAPRDLGRRGAWASPGQESGILQYEYHTVESRDEAMSESVEPPGFAARPAATRLMPAGGYPAATS